MGLELSWGSATCLPAILGRIEFATADVLESDLVAISKETKVYPQVWATMKIREW